MASIDQGVLERVDWTKQGGLVPAVCQDLNTGVVRMVGYLNREALEITLETKRVTFWSRSRQQLWTKGETSHNELRVCRVLLDCDRDTLLLLVEPQGPTCHRGEESCFGQVAATFHILSELDELIQGRRTRPRKQSYTSRLFEQGTAAIVRKVGEEAAEMMASVHEEEVRTVQECADLFYHALVLLAHRKGTLKDVLVELEARRER